MLNHDPSSAGEDAAPGPTRFAFVTAAGGPDSGPFVDAWDRLQPPAPATAGSAPSGRTRRVGRELFQTAALALVIFLGTHSAVQGREVEGPSMQPTYHTGQRLFVNRAVYFHLNPHRLFGFLPFVDAGDAGRYLFHGPRHGDVVVFRPPFQSHDDLIKRVIGVPGDHVVVAGGQVFVNGQLQSEPRVAGAETVCAGRWCDVRLGPDEYYVMGDNRNNSSDSRVFGPIRGGTIVGKAWLVVHPFGDFGLAR